MRRLSGVLLVGFLGTLVKQDPALGIFAVIFLEEMGIPLLIPGDVFILFVGAQIGRGRVSWPLAFLAIMAGAILGASILFSVSRRFGAPFLHKYGRYIHVYPRELDAAERVFHRWGLWAVILGRHIPGLRVVISAISGLLRFELARFAVAVAVSSAAWALIFLALGAHFGRRLRPLIHMIPPAHLIPWALFGLLCLTVAGYVLRRRLYESGYHLFRYTMRIGRGH